MSTEANKGSNTLSSLLGLYNKNQYTTLNETITISEYADRVVKNPALIRNAYQRLYDMVVEKGSYQFERYRKTLTHYKFFDNAVYGLEDTLDGLVRFLRGAAGHFGTEKRVLLLHGPVGSSKSTICRALKKGLENYTKTPQGCLYTYKWVNLPTGPDGVYNKSEERAAMNEDPLLLLPEEMRVEILKQANEKWIASTPEAQRNSQYMLRLEGEINPRSKEFMNFLLAKYNGDLGKVLSEHVQVIRLVFSESDRRGIGTFQPKDEKNQDATELTGDIHYGQLTTYTDSDGRAFNFDGEFCVANRGLCEFIEVLKLAKEFLYDLLGASQEHSIKPKKFSQVTIDEVIIGHSVKGDTPIPHEYDGVLNVLPISEMQNLDYSKLRVFSVNVTTRQVELSGVKSVFSHKFEGEWVNNHQNGDTLTTTPNHSVYNENFEKFYPGDDRTSPIVQMTIPENLIEGKPTTSRWNEFFATAIREAA